MSLALLRLLIPFSKELLYFLGVLHAQIISENFAIEDLTHKLAEVKNRVQVKTLNSRENLTLPHRPKESIYKTSKKNARSWMKR